MKLVTIGGKSVGSKAASHSGTCCGNADHRDGMWMDREP